MIKKTLTTTALVAVLGLAVIGCGSSQGTITTPDTIQRATTTTSSYPKSVNRFLLQASDLYPYEDDETLISLGMTSCETIQSFGSLTQTMIEIAFDPDWTVEMAGDAAAMFAISVPAFCPQFQSEIDRIARS
jgi:hypothetical protein